MENLPAHLGAILPFCVPFALRQRLARAVVEHGKKSTMAHVGEDGWTSLTCRQPITKLTETLDRATEYHARLDPRVDWDWIDTPVTDLCREIATPVLPLFRRVTRVVTILQNPGATVRMHRDPVAGNDYGGGALLMHEVPSNPANDWHEKNRRLSIKVIVTEREGDNGITVARLTADGEDYLYDTGDSFFAINEVDMFHGARPVDFHRGVFWLDGEIDIAAYDALALRPIPVRRLEGRTEDLSWGLKKAGVKWDAAPEAPPASPPSSQTIQTVAVCDAIPADVVSACVADYESRGTYRGPKMRIADVGESLGWLHPHVCAALGRDPGSLVFTSGNFFRHTANPYLPHTDWHPAERNVINVVVPLHHPEGDAHLVVFDQEWHNPAATWCMGQPVVPFVVNVGLPGWPGMYPLMGHTGRGVDEALRRKHLPHYLAHMLHGLSGVAIPWRVGSVIAFDTRRVHATSTYTGTKLGISLRFRPV